MRQLSLYFTATLFLFCAAPSTFAQTYSVTTAVDVSVALNDTPGIAPQGVPQKQLAHSHTGVSSLGFNRTGQKTTFDTRFVYGLTRTRSDIFVQSETHTATINSVTRLTRNLQLRLTDTYFRSPNLTSFNFARGVIGVGAEPFMESGTITNKRKTTANLARAGFEYTSGPRAAWSFSASHDIHRYADAMAAGEGVAANVQQFAADIAYRHQLSQKTNWHAAYSATQYEFQGRPADNSRTHAVQVGFSYRLSPTAVMDVGGGPSYLDILHATGGREDIGFNARVGIVKILANDQLSLSYVRRNGTTAGVGTSDNQTITFDHSRQFGKYVNVHTAVSLYDSKQRRVTVVQVRGASAAVITGILLSPHLTLNISGNYQKQQGDDIFYTERRQVNLSLRFTPPAIGRGQK